MWCNFQVWPQRVLKKRSTQILRTTGQSIKRLWIKTWTICYSLIMKMPPNFKRTLPLRLRTFAKDYWKKVTFKEATTSTLFSSYFFFLAENWLTSSSGSLWPVMRLGSWVMQSTSWSCIWRRLSWTSWGKHDNWYWKYLIIFTCFCHKDFDIKL